jgi:hypothetical protein
MEIRNKSEASDRDQSGIKMPNSKLETLNSEQTQISNAQNSNEKAKLTFEFYILDLFRI